MAKALILDLFGVTVVKDELNAPLAQLVRKVRHKGMKTFLVSNWDETQAARYPELLELFDKMYFSAQTGFIKPDLRAYEQILRENDLEPGDCIYFDDAPEHVVSAQSLGISAHLYTGIDDLRAKLKP